MVINKMKRNIGRITKGGNKVKYFRWTVLILAMVFLLAACSNNNDPKTDDTPMNNNNVSDNNTSETNDDASNDVSNDAIGNNDASSDEALPVEAATEEDMKILFESLPFTKVDVEVDYSNGQEFEVEMKQRNDGSLEADVDDEINQVDLEDDLQAFNYIYTRVKDLNIEQNTSKEDAIPMILDAFELSDDYVKFEAEFTFTEGTTIEYKEQ